MQCYYRRRRLNVADFARHTGLFTARKQAAVMTGEGVPASVKVVRHYQQIVDVPLDNKQRESTPTDVVKAKSGICPYEFY